MLADATLQISEIPNRLSPGSDICITPVRALVPVTWNGFYRSHQPWKTTKTRSGTWRPQDVMVNPIQNTMFPEWPCAPETQVRMPLDQAPTRAPETDTFDVVHDLDLTKIDPFRTRCSVVTNLRVRFVPPLPAHLRAQVSVLFQDTEFAHFDQNYEFPLGLLRWGPSFSLRVRAQGFTLHDILGPHTQQQALEVTADKYFYQEAERGAGHSDDPSEPSNRSLMMKTESWDYLQNLTFDDFLVWRMAPGVFGVFRWRDFAVLSGQDVARTDAVSQQLEAAAGATVTYWHTYRPRNVSQYPAWQDQVMMYSFVIPLYDTYHEEACVWLDLEILLSMGDDNNDFHYFIEERNLLGKLVGTSKGVVRQGIVRFRPQGNDHKLHVKFFSPSSAGVGSPQCLVRTVASFVNAAVTEPLRIGDSHMYSPAAAQIGKIGFH